MSAPLADVFSLLSYGGGTDEYGNPSYLQVDAGKQAGDPSIAQVAQQLQQSGALTAASPQQAGVGFNVDYSKLPKTSLGTSVQGWSPTPYQPGSNGDPSKLFNSKAVINDPNYGWITRTANVNNASGDVLDRYGGAIPYAIMAGLGAGFGALTPLSGMLGQAFNQAGNVIEGNKFNPLTLLGIGLGGLGVPSWATTLGGLGMNAARGGGINPITALLTLGRLAQGFNHG